jgi:hypothetical protein
VEVHYFINTEKRIVVCKAEPYAGGCNPLKMPLTYKQSVGRAFFEMCDEDDLSFIGKAVCMDEDEFDVEFGKRLAYDKAMLKLFDAKKKFFMENIKDLESYIADDKELIADVDKQIAKATERFEKKIKEVM